MKVYQMVSVLVVVRVVVGMSRSNHQVFNVRVGEKDLSRNVCREGWMGGYIKFNVVWMRRWQDPET